MPEKGQEQGVEALRQYGEPGSRVYILRDDVLALLEGQDG